MASELPVVIDEELLCCSLCMHSFRDPRILPCLHTFCRVCLETQLAKTWPTYIQRLNNRAFDRENHKDESNIDSNSGESSADGSGALMNFENNNNISPDVKDHNVEKDNLYEEPNGEICDNGYEEPVPTATSNSNEDANTTGHPAIENQMVADKQDGCLKDIPRLKHPPVPHKPAGLVVPPLPPGVVITRTPEVDALLVQKLKSPVSSPEQMPKYPEPLKSVDITISPPLPPREPGDKDGKGDKNDVAVENEPLPAILENPNSPTQIVPDMSTVPNIPFRIPTAIQKVVNSEKKSAPMTEHKPKPVTGTAPETAPIQKNIMNLESNVEATATPKSTVEPEKIECLTAEEEGYYEECELYEEVDQHVQDKVAIMITQSDDDEENENFYHIAEPDYPPQKNKEEKLTLNSSRNDLDKKPKSKERAESIKDTEKSPKKGWLIGNIFRRSTPKKEKKGKKTELSIKRCNSAPDTSCVILRDLPSPPVEISPYSPSPTLVRPVNESTGPSQVSIPQNIELTADGTPVLPPRNTRPPPPLPTKRSISHTPIPTTVPQTPTPSIASLPNVSSVSPLSGAIPKPPFSGNPSIVNCPEKEQIPMPKSQTEVKMNCPTCSSEFPVPPNGILGLKVNSFALSLQEVVLSQSSEKKNCNNCETAPAKFRCLDCRHYLCSGCRNAHNWLKITKSHRVMTLGELQSGRYQQELTEKQEIKCDLHSENNVELMCLYCDKPICAECKVNDHFEHRTGHLNEAADRDRDLIGSLINSVKDQIGLFHTTKQQLNQYDLQCSDEKRELIECLAKQRDSITEAVNEAFLDLVQEIDTAYTQETSNTERVRDQMNSTISHMNHNSVLAQQLLTHGKTEDILLMSRLLKVNLNNFSFVAPFELDTRAFVQYSPTGFSKPMLVQLFGRLAKRRSDIVKSKPVIQPKLLEMNVQQTSEDFPLLSCYRAKTVSDSLGCKPCGLSISKNDDIIIVDDTNKKVKVFDPSGIVKMELKPTDEHAFIDPWDVTITSQGYLAVTDRGARKVKVFNSSGRFIYEFGPHLKSPWGIAANSKGHLIVTDILAKTVFVHDQCGTLLHQIECKGHNNLFVCPEYVKVNHNDDIIVSDFMKHCITVFDSQGRFLFRYGTRGTSVHEFTTPCGIGVTKSGNILVADYSNKRIHKLTRDGQFVQFMLTAKDGLQTPQTLSVNSQGHLVLLDGTNIKTFGMHHEPTGGEDSDSDMDPIYEPLQFSNKLYEGAALRFSRTISESDA